MHSIRILKYPSKSEVLSTYQLHSTFIKTLSGSSVKYYTVYVIDFLEEVRSEHVPVNTMHTDTLYSNAM